MKYSRILLICFLVISACAPKPEPIDEYRRGFRLSRSVIEEYGQLEGVSEVTYLEGVRDRVLAGLSQRRPAAFQYNVILLNTSQPLAYSPGGGFVLLSKGLVASLAHEAELAFVLAHEIAHQELGHTLEQEPWHAPNSSDTIKAHELEADRFAVGALRLAGYDARAAVGALMNTYSSVRQNQPTDLNERLTALQTNINTLHFDVPATYDRRDFQKFRLRIGSN